MFNIKTWIDRVSEFPTRRLLTKVSDGTSEQVIVSRDEGTVTTAGDTFDANTMNNLEARIASAFTADDQKMGDLNDLTTTDKTSLVDAINEVAQSGGGGGGSSTLAGLTDVSLTTPTDGQVLKYDATNAEWVNANESGGGGTASSVSYDNTTSGLQATDVQDAIDEVAGEIADKADIDSPAFTGTPTAPTPTAGDDSTKIATTAFVQNELDDINSDFAYDSQASVTVPNQTSPWTDICSFSLTAGTWLVVATINYTAKASGYRCGLISSTSSASGADYRGTVIVAASPADVTRIQVMAILTPSSTTTFYVEGKQNSGEALTASARVQRIKLK